MSLITCPECKKEITDTVENCPHCGYKVKPKQEDKKESTGTNKWLIRGIYLALIILIGTCVVNIVEMPVKLTTLHRFKVSTSAGAK